MKYTTYIAVVALIISVLVMRANRHPMLYPSAEVAVSTIFTAPLQTFESVQGARLSQSGAIISRGDESRFIAYIIPADGGNVMFFAHRKNVDFDMETLIDKQILIRYSKIDVINEHGFVDNRANVREIKAVKVNGERVFIDRRNLPTFFTALIVAILSLTWIIFRIIVRAKKKEVENTADAKKIEEEYFFENWGVYRKTDKYSLSYISKITGNANRRTITKEEFELVKNGKMNLDDFSEKYTLL